jgi:hypothetical protein
LNASNHHPHTISDIEQMVDLMEDDEDENEAASTPTTY